MKKPVEGLPVSVQVRLVRHAQAIGLNPNLVLGRYATERFLYRLSKTPHADRFILKGGLLMLVWLGENIRPTRDIDLLGCGDLSERALVQTFAEVCTAQVVPDGVEYLADSIEVGPIRRGDEHGGMRVHLQGRLGKARLFLQVDVGIGDSVEPPPEWLAYPSLLGFPGPRLRAYRPETTIAEKLHAMVTLGEANSRMRDYFDVYSLSQRLGFEGDSLAAAVRSTFVKRGTPIPRELPVALTAQFGASRDKQMQWEAFVKKGDIVSAPIDLHLVVERVAAFLLPVIRGTGDRSGHKVHWEPEGPWTPRK